MGRVNIEIPDDLHQQLRTESAIKNVPIKMIAINAMREHYEDMDMDISPELLD